MEENNKLPRDFKGVWIPKEIWLNPNLNAIEKIIFAEIDSLDNGEKGCYASNEHLANFCGCSENKISTCIKKLIDLGLVEVTGFDGRHRYLRVLKKQNEPFEKTKADFEKTKASNINNNIDNKDIINNINIINKQNLENSENTKTNDSENENLTTNIDKSIKQNKKISKKQNCIKIYHMLEEFTNNENVKNALKNYLKVRTTDRSLNVIQWELILANLRKECGTNSKYAIELIEKATACGWMQIVYNSTFTGKPKSSYSSKPTFDNTANRDVPKGLASMTEEERQDYIENELAKDENGNFYKF
jgi:DNA-binding transcriptional regulator GbsR (MarR family)